MMAEALGDQGTEGQGGMYNILKLIGDRLEKETFTAQEVIQLSGLSRQSTINNLTRLTKAGLLERIEYRDKTHPNGRRVKYKIGKGVHDFINNILYG